MERSGPTTGLDQSLLFSLGKIWSLGQKHKTIKPKVAQEAVVKEQDESQIGRIQFETGEKQMCRLN